MSAVEVSLNGRLVLIVVALQVSAVVFRLCLPISLHWAWVLAPSWLTLAFAAVVALYGLVWL